MNPFVYNGNNRIVRVIDGDTVVVDIDLGFYTTKRETIRLYGINAPEITGTSKAAGEAAKTYLSGLLPVGALCLVESVKWSDKYGRFLAKIAPLDTGLDVSWSMLSANMAVRYME